MNVFARYLKNVKVDKMGKIYNLEQVIKLFASGDHLKKSKLTADHQVIVYLKGVRKVIGLILKRPRAVTVSFSLLRTPPF